LVLNANFEDDYFGCAGIMHVVCGGLEWYHWDTGHIFLVVLVVYSTAPRIKEGSHLPSISGMLYGEVISKFAPLNEHKTFKPCEYFVSIPCRKMCEAEVCVQNNLSKRLI
jgi:hypothetical protein